MFNINSQGFFARNLTDINVTEHFARYLLCLHIKLLCKRSNKIKIQSNNLNLEELVIHV